MALTGFLITFVVLFISLGIVFWYSETHYGLATVHASDYYL